jgi:hypothetical protein
MGLLARALRPSGPTHGGPPCSSLSSPGDVVSVVLNLVSSPPSAWQASFNPSQSDLPALGEVAECSVQLGITCECYLALVESHQVF